MSKEYEITSRNKVKRVPQRGHYDKETLYSILDKAFLCHVGFSVDGQPFVIPTIYGRDGDLLYLHGATTSRMLVNMKKGIPVCLTVTHLDGLVLARSAFHHSMNYRSAVVFGTAFELEEEKKEAALYCVSENIMKGRWDEVRTPNAKELKATSVIAVKIDQASSKIRTGGPKDEPEDYELDAWAGVLPIAYQVGAPLNDEELRPGIEASKVVSEFSF